MAKKKSAYKFEVWTKDGAKLSGSGPCTDREGLAIYMVALGPKPNTPLGKALEVYLSECEKTIVSGTDQREVHRHTSQA